MDQTSVIELYPPSAKRVPIQGLYLNAELEGGKPVHTPFVYTNFVTSLDGRIAIVDPNDRQRKVPPHTANPRDWRLFQELAARADLILTSGHYLRQLARGTAQDILPVSPASEFKDLHNWRTLNRLPPQPDVAIFTRGLEFPIPHRLLRQGRRIIVLSPADADANAIARLEEHGIEVIRTQQPGELDARESIHTLGERGYKRIYSVAGPYIFHSLLASNVLDTLF
ncbi:hypothetical protein CAI21_10945 [Alkalilimnicola ehrlichii]|uniref:Bacterial bifunctional deaminase-reductase C-terminal domain-containing protein n=1 Tax=Alkalilimnicola ehrlichii TaxID=351052 RepID=A0A3E0WZT7_9GAMM|nr:dihydrofolate reductase family protein [Alkalilimnicola ehrlichii]RFA28965.1 hypothetical protein CAI21_10945 [Alkalilimnicola ehrlichii]RFA38601.1 hypothetical protein CAL65_04485 [Alkalilimnicola ehrlichii]